VLNINNADLPFCALGHETKDCTELRVKNLARVADMTPAEAIAKLKAASDERDLDDFREVGRSTSADNEASC
jgi:hypothetical protein